MYYLFVIVINYMLEFHIFYEGVYMLHILT